MAKSRVEMVRVIRDCGNAALDYFIPKSRAIQLYMEGKLHWDVTNGHYGSNDGSKVE